MPQRFFAAEFPHDNPTLWWRWVPADPAPAEAIVAAPAPAEPVAPVPIAAPKPEPEAAPERAASRDDYARLLTILADVALAAGMTRAAALLATHDTAVSAFPPELARSAAAWRDVLTGASDDYVACGDLPLDEWAAFALAAVAGAPERASDLRRELRARGLAAFGIIDRAA